MKGSLYIFSLIFAHCFMLIYGNSSTNDRAVCKNIKGQIINPMVEKNTLIQKEYSIGNGAKSLGTKIVSDATECFNLCCERYDTENCDVAQMHYRQALNIYGDQVVEKYCFLYSCGTPSKCLFSSDELTLRYHVIKLEPDYATTPYYYSSTNSGNTDESTTTDQKESYETPETSPLVRETTSTTTTTAPFVSTMIPVIENATKENHVEGSEEKCPPGVPVALCADNPCKTTSCPGDPTSICRPNYCGGCNAKFYLENGERADCDLPEANGFVANHNEQSLTVTEDDYEAEPIETLPGPGSIKSDEEKKKEADKKKEDYEKKDGDDYYQTERRRWEDGDDEDQGIIDESTLAPRTTEKQVKTKVIVKSMDTFFSIPLFIALMICLTLAFFIFYRYRCQKRGRPKKLNVDDGDYLINGMYL